jgi:hypothetical protein
VSSALPETTTVRPSSCAVATANTGPVWPVKAGPTGFPVARSHTRTVLSQLPETTTVRPSSGAVATEDTGPAWPVTGEPTGAPVARSHTRIVLSALPEMTTVRPSSCAVVTPNTQLVWPVRACSMIGAAAGVVGCSGTVPAVGRFAQSSAAPTRASVTISAPMPTPIRAVG